MIYKPAILGLLAFAILWPLCAFLIGYHLGDRAFERKCCGLLLMFYGIWGICLGAVLLHRSLNSQMYSPALATACFQAVGCTLLVAGPTLGTIFVIVGITERRRRPGFCWRCGYNLTGNVSGICPECGTPIAKPGAQNSTVSDD
ncbi:MAG: hypothetical protein KAV82_06110 [Phycisphaerae bacterium]|nr:hypothetical protein [Phycisphaerae bacterium]